MNKSTEYFENNGYVVLGGALGLEECDSLVRHMFDLKQQGKLVNDDQCPLSDAVYGDPVFDSILAKFAKPIGDAVGRTLLPTYTYARIYRPGEILKKHKDRPACEISATLTLGYSAKKVWPIYFDEQKEIGVDLEPGELAVYKGCEILHWRAPFKGDWHVQVFLHYVDANGPYKNCAFDGRGQLGVEKTTNVVEPNTPNTKPNQNEISDVDFAIQKAIGLLEKTTNFDFVSIPNKDNTFPGHIFIDKNNFSKLRFTDEECNKIISLTNDSYPSTASVGGSRNNSKIAKQIRSASIYNIDNIPENRWIFDKVIKAVTFANTMHFDYDISGIAHSIQLIHYSSDVDVPGHYDWHIDSGPGDSATRKISFTAQLSDPNDYEGCELIINNHGDVVTGTKERGAIHMFPSYMLHKVTPITKGDRYALVIWVHGTRRFK